MVIDHPEEAASSALDARRKEQVVDALLMCLSQSHTCTICHAAGEDRANKDSYIYIYVIVVVDVRMPENRYDVQCVRAPLRK